MIYDCLIVVNGLLLNTMTLFFFITNNSWIWLFFFSVLAEFVEEFPSYTSNNISEANSKDEEETERKQDQRVHVGASHLSQLTCWREQKRKFSKILKSFLENTSIWLFIKILLKVLCFVYKIQKWMLPKMALARENEKIIFTSHRKSSSRSNSKSKKHQSRSSPKQRNWHTFTHNWY